MEFISERTAFTMISETVVKAGVSLFNAMKYIYMIADKDLYNINIKDIFRISLNNITDTTCLYNTGIRLDKERCAEMNTPEYERVLSLMVYSFAVRLPVLKNVKTAGGFLNDKQIKTIYDMVVAKGAANYDNVIPDDFEEVRPPGKGRQTRPGLRRRVVQGLHLHLRPHARRHHQPQRIPAGQRGYPLHAVLFLPGGGAGAPAEFTRRAGVITSPDGSGFSLLKDITI